MAGSIRSGRWSDHPLLGWLLGLAVALTLLHGIGYLVLGPGPLLSPLPWFIPVIHTFVALAALSIAFLAFGRYSVLHEPATFWLGIAFVTFIVFLIFYALYWPDLMPDDPTIALRGQGFAAWFYHLAFSALAVFFLVALLAGWPRASASPWLGWPGLVVWCALASTAIGLLAILRFDLLPVLVVDGTFTLLNHLWNVLIVLGFALAALLAARRYASTDDSLFGYVAITALVLAFAVLTSILGGRYYGLWWYWQRVLWILGFSVMLFGMLAEYASLLRRQFERSRELEAAQGEVIAERNRLEVIINAAPFGIILHSADDGRVLLANDAADAILGRPVKRGSLPADSIGYHNIRYPSGDAYELEDLPASCALRGEVCAGIEMLVEHASGRHAYVLATAEPLRDARGEAVGVIVGLQDITALREQTLLREEFLSAAAHELRTPVTTIKGYAQLLRGWIAENEDSTERERRAIKVINSQCDRLDRRVQELLEVVQIRRAGVKPRLARFNLADAVAQVVADTTALMPSARISVAQSEATPVEASRESIAEVISTLVDNAVRHSPAEAEVEVRVFRRGDEALAMIRDHGPGIARERQPHIFEPFYEPAPTGEPGYRGVVGLGLYLGPLAVERYRGRIWLVSVPGAGAAFFVSLPLAETERG